MLELNLNPFPCLATERLVLRRVGSRDEDYIFELHTDERVNAYLERHPPASIKEIRKYIEDLDLSMHKNESITWAIALRNDSRLIGIIFYWNIYKVDCRAEIGYELHPDFQGRGIMQEAFRKVLDYGFEIMKLHSIEAELNPANSPSIRLLERNGFVREAYFKQCTYHKGKFMDRAVYSLLNQREEAAVGELQYSMQQ